MLSLPWPPASIPGWGTKILQAARPKKNVFILFISNRNDSKIRYKCPAFFLFIYLFILAALGLRCHAEAFSNCGESGLLVAVRGLQQLWLVGSAVVARGL